MLSRYRWTSKAFWIVPEGRPFTFGVSESWSDSSLETSTGGSKRAGAFPLDWREAGKGSMSETRSRFMAGTVTSFLVGCLQRQKSEITEAKELNDIPSRPLFWSVGELVRA